MGYLSVVTVGVGKCFFCCMETSSFRPWHKEGKRQISTKICLMVRVRHFQDNQGAGNLLFTYPPQPDGIQTCDPSITSPILLLLCAGFLKGLLQESIHLYTSIETYIKTDTDIYMYVFLYFSLFGKKPNTCLLCFCFSDIIFSSEQQRFFVPTPQVWLQNSLSLSHPPPSLLVSAKRQNYTDTSYY